ncbi:D-alanine--D-alanine ligase [Mesorhizobium australafricanum]|nr:D-alanine--D-alanine ligase [Mesorhizobium sp. VK3E]
MSTEEADRPFSVMNLYHVSREDGLVRKIRFHNAFTIAELQAHLSGSASTHGRTIPATFDAIEPNEEYLVNLLHGEFGEDGGVQTIAALSGLRGTFGDPRVASLTMNKYAMSAFVSSLLPREIVSVPHTILVNPQNAYDAVRTAMSLHGQIVIKPNSLGSSLFAKLFKCPQSAEQEMHTLLESIFTYDLSAVIQEFIPGDEYTCGCIIGSSGLVMLPVVKVDAPNQFYGSEQKSSTGKTNRYAISDGDDISIGIKSVASAIASSLNLCNMARFDFRFSNDQKVYFLECNYIPGLSRNGSFETMLTHFGMNVVDLISWVASNSIPFKNRRHYIANADEQLL